MYFWANIDFARTCMVFTFASSAQFVWSLLIGAFCCFKSLHHRSRFRCQSTFLPQLMFLVYNSVRDFKTEIRQRDPRFWLWPIITRLLRACANFRDIVRDCCSSMSISIKSSEISFVFVQIWGFFNFFLELFISHILRWIKV